MSHYDLIPEPMPPTEEVLPSGTTVAWQWRDLLIVGVVFLVGAFFIAVLARLVAKSAPVIWLLQALPPAGSIAAIVILIYAWLILCIYLWVVRRRGSTWHTLGMRSFPWRWLIILPGLYLGQLFVAGLVNLLLISLFLGGQFENPQLKMLEESLTVLAPTATPATQADGEADVSAAKKEQPTTETANTKENPSSTLPQEAPSTEGEEATNRLPIQLSKFDLLLLILAIGVVTPIAEELLFRGAIYPLQRRRHSAATAILLNALFFAFIHLIPVLFPALFIIGLTLAWLRERTQSIWPSVFLHGLQNTVAVLVFSTLLSQR